MTKTMLTKEDIKLLMMNIPAMLDDLSNEVLRKKFSKTWKRYNEKGAMGYEIVELYKQIKANLDDKYTKKYL